MEICVQREGIPSFKAFMAYKGAIMVDDDELYTLLGVAGGLGAERCSSSTDLCRYLRP